MTEIRQVGYIQRCGPAIDGGGLRSVFPVKWHINISPRIQEGLPEGTTLIPIILGSDKTRLTMLGSNKEAWPVYMSIRNIWAKDRNTPSNGSWVPLAYIPLVVKGSRKVRNRSKVASRGKVLRLHTVFRVLTQSEDLISSLCSIYSSTSS